MAAVVRGQLTPPRRPESPPPPPPPPPQQHDLETPPSYDDAVRIPGDSASAAAVREADELTVSDGGEPFPRVRRQSSAFVERARRLSIDEGDNESDESHAAAMRDYGLRGEADEEEYAMEDESFEPYDGDAGGDAVGELALEIGCASDAGRREDELLSQRSTSVRSMGSHNGARCTATSPSRRPECKRTSRARTPALSPRPSQPSLIAPSSLQYDEQTYSIVSKLRALNRQLSLKAEQQARQLEVLQSERKLHVATIQTLKSDLRMVRQTLKQIQSTASGPVDRMVITHSPERHHSRSLKDRDGSPPSYASLAGDRVGLPHVTTPSQSPRSPRSPRPATTTSVSPSSPRKLDGSPRSPVTASPPSSGFSARRPIHTAPRLSSPSSSSSSPSDKLLAAKIEKLEVEKRDLAARHAHQLANYSHELSRLERQVENAQKLVQAKDYELRLQKSRHLYACCSSGSSAPSSSSSSSSSSSTSTAGKNGVHRHHHAATLLSDALWRDLLPSAPPASALPFTSHVGLAFEQLLGHQLLSFYDRMVDATTRDWLHEIRRCGLQVLGVHHSFQCMAQTFKTLAACCHIYELAEAFTREVKQLTRAEQAFLYIMDPAENEFWCRIPRPDGDGLAPLPSSSKDMITVRSRVMPLAGAGGVSAVAAEHTGTTAQNTALLAATAASHVPCGLASWVFHTKKPLVIPAGHAVRHPHFSTAPDSTDRLMHFKSASTLLMPVLHGSTTLGVVQVCGKLTQVAALGVSISLEKCEAFTSEDQVVLTMLSHFLSGVLPKAAYFTEVESNKVNEETLIQLAPEIFTCLRFEELGKIVIQNAKAILDADRCSLFVADNDDRMLFNWQSDISGKGGVEVVNDVKKSTMRIPFGHGIVGMVAETRQVINIPDAYEDPRFNSSWDKKTNYRTKSILTVPILTTVASAKGKAPIRRRRSQHDVYGAVITEKGTDGEAAKGGHDHGHGHGDHDQAAEPEPPRQALLGVVQVINKSGGAPFRSKDEFLLQTISKLIALAIENSQLFQKTQELCASLGKLIADADLVEAVASLGACAEDIIGVESAAIYVLSTEQGSRELVTFHRKRRHKIVIKEQMYRHSLLERALLSRELVIVNDISPATPHFNAYVDSIGGIAARNVLFMPLLVDDPEDATQTAKKLIGVLHLVNTRGRKLKFERFDLFLSIVSSQTCSVLASILEKQAMLRQQEQTRHLLDTTLCFFKEMSPVGIINAVYNTCASLFGVEKAHLFLWESDHRAMWTAKLSPNAESVSAAMASTPQAIDSTAAAAAATTSGSSAHAPSLRSQARRISVLADQKIRVPANEGLLEHVLSKGGVVVVRQWLENLDELEEAEAEAENSNNRDPGGRRTPPMVLTRGLGVVSSSSSTPSRSASLQSIEVSKFAVRACRSDYRAGFTKHSVVACPVWDLYGLEIVGVVVLLFAKGRAPAPSELGNLPILSRQISGALNVCGDLRAVTQRCQRLQEIAEGYSPRRASQAMSLTLSARGQLVAFSQPLNAGTSGFSVASLLHFGHGQQHSKPTTGSFPTLDLSKLPLDEDGHRWIFLLSGASLHEMANEHYVNWIGKDVPGVSAALGVFDRLRTDLQSVYIRKEIVRGMVTLPKAVALPSSPASGGSSSPYSLPRAVQFQLRLLLWEFADAQLWRVDLKRALRVFDCVDPSRSRRVSRQHVETALTTNGRGVELDQLEWDLVHAAFADPETDLVDVARMFEALAPSFKVCPRFSYELIPVLDTITQSVISVHVLLASGDV